MRQERIKITKLEAARRQLETAIDLFFSDKDLLSIYTLVSATYELLRGINKSRPKTSMIKDQLSDKALKISSDMQKRVLKDLNREANFLKHADNDPDEEILFRPEKATIFLYDACIAYYEITGIFPQKMKCLYDWLNMTEDKLFESLKDGRYKAGLAYNREGNAHVSKSAFFEIMMGATYDEKNLITL